MVCSQEEALCRLISPPPLDPTVIDAHCPTPHKMYVCVLVLDADCTRSQRLSALISEAGSGRDQSARRGVGAIRSERGLRGGARTDLPTSEAGTAFRSSPRPDEARFESHARQLCASPIPQPCVLVLLPTLPPLCAHAPDI